MAMYRGSNISVLIDEIVAESPSILNDDNKYMIEDILRLNTAWMLQLMDLIMVDNKEELTVTPYVEDAGYPQMITVLDTHDNIQAFAVIGVEMPIGGGEVPVVKRMATNCFRSLHKLIKQLGDHLIVIPVNTELELIK